MSKSSLAKALSSLVLVSLLAWQAVIAQQPCNDDLVMNTNGAWKKLSDATMKSGPDRAQAIARIDRFGQLLRAAYPEPRGTEAGWYRSMINNPLVKDGPVPYQLTGMFLQYFCNTNVTPTRLERGGETGTWFYVYANHFNWFADYNMFFTVSGNPVFLLTRKVGAFKGYPLYEGIHNQNSNTGINYSRAIIMTRPGQSPYVPVTRRQFLKAYLEHNEIRKTQQVAAFEKTYATDQRRREDAVRRVGKSFDDDMQPARDLLSTLSEEAAGQPAILDKGQYGGDFESFTTEEQGGRMLVRLNPAYFDAKLPRSVPQFLIVYWRWDKGNAGENFKNQLEANFDFTALRQMIDQ